MSRATCVQNKGASGSYLGKGRKDGRKAGREEGRTDGRKEGRKEHDFSEK